MNEIEVIGPLQFVEVWRDNNNETAGEVDPCTTGICEDNDGQPVSEVGRPPAHPYCICDTVIVLRERE